MSDAGKFDVIPRSVFGEPAADDPVLQAARHGTGHAGYPPSVAYSMTAPGTVSRTKSAISRT